MEMSLDIRKLFKDRCSKDLFAASLDKEKKRKTNMVVRPVMASKIGTSQGSAQEEYGRAKENVYFEVVNRR
jgi:hypothetical protein